MGLRPTKVDEEPDCIGLVSPFLRMFFNRAVRETSAPRHVRSPLCSPADEGNHQLSNPMLDDAKIRHRIS